MRNTQRRAAMIRVRALGDLPPGESTRVIAHVPVAVFNADGELRDRRHLHAPGRIVVGELARGLPDRVPVRNLLAGRTCSTSTSRATSGPTSTAHASSSQARWNPSD